MPLLLPVLAAALALHAGPPLQVTSTLPRFLAPGGALTVRGFAGRSERDGNFRYAPGKWTIKEVLGHITDTERIFAYRALRIARCDQTPLASFEQDDFVKNGGFAGRKLADLAQEFDIVREASILLFRSFNDAAWSRRGVASQKEVTVRALGFITAGHQIHHRLILEEQYFPAIPRA